MVTQAQRDAAVNQIGAGMAPGVTPTVLGYGDPVPTPGGFIMRPGGEPIQETVMAAEPITVADVAASLSNLTYDDQVLLALDMFEVDLFSDFNYMFDDNNQIDQPYFVKKVNEAIGLAATSAEYGLDTDFLSVLLQTYDGTPDDVAAAIAEARAASAKPGGRAINYLDPFGLIDTIKKASSSVTGRMATPEEQQAFVKSIRDLQTSGATNINVGARAEAFAREQAPEEAKAMDYAGAAGVLMQALGMRGR